MTALFAILLIIATCAVYLSAVADLAVLSEMLGGGL